MYPAHNPKPGSRAPGKGSPAYSFGGVRVELDKRISPGPANYEKAAAPNLGRQRVDSTTHSLPVYGMGSGTREGREEFVHVAKGRLFSNNLPSRYLLGGSLDPVGTLAPPAPPSPGMRIVMIICTLVTLILFGFLFWRNIDCAALCM